MLHYGQYVAQQLRNCSMAIKGFGINKSVAEVNADSNARPFGGVIGDSASAYYANGGYGRCLGAPAAYGWASREGAAGTAYWGAERQHGRPWQAASRQMFSSNRSPQGPSKGSCSSCFSGTRRSAPT